MTLLEFCKNFFPNEEIFTEQGETITVNTKKLLDLEQAGKESGQISWFQITPSDILDHAEPGDWRYYDPRPGGCYSCWDGTERPTLSEESARRMRQFRLVIDPEVAGMDFDVRRPYFRMRGRPVTEEQAFDIIRRTDNFFRYDIWDKYRVNGLVGDRLVLDNVLYSPNFYPHPRGWVRPDGVIGQNGITGKYPNEDEFVGSMLPLMLAFPYLDLMIGVTDWDEIPDYVWDAMGSEDEDYEELMSREDYPDFEEHIVYGIWLHGGALELMAPARAREKYAEYCRLYSGPNEAIFTSHYCHDNHIHPADFEYLKRCIRSHGLDPEKVLARYGWDPVTGLRYLGPTPEERAQRAKEMAEAQERFRQMWEDGWSRLPEPIQALHREAQELMQAAGVSDWVQEGIWRKFTPAGFLSRARGAWPDPPVGSIKIFTRNALSEALQEKLIELLEQMKREWDSAQGAGGEN